MRSRLLLAAVGATLITTVVVAQAQQRRRHMNPVIDLLEQGKPVFGVTPPTGPRGGGGGRGGRGGAAAAATTGGAVADAPPPPPAPPQKTPLELAKEALAPRQGDYFFNGGMEGSVDRGIAAFSEFMTAMGQAGWSAKDPSPRLSHAFAVKTPSIRSDTSRAGADSLQARMVSNVSKQLNAGVNILNFAHLETADELRRGIAAMRFKSKGGTRPDDVGIAPAVWGLTEAQYKEKADVWPLNPAGELIAAPIVESKLAVANVREIAAVKGLGVLVIGAGTLGQVYRGDQPGFEAAVEQILSACKEFKVPCGYPVSEANVEAIVKKGYTFLIIQAWGDGAFRTIELGHKAGGR